MDVGGIGHRRDIGLNDLTSWPIWFHLLVGFGFCQFYDQKYVWIFIVLWHDHRNSWVIENGMKPRGKMGVHELDGIEGILGLDWMAQPSGQYELIFGCFDWFWILSILWPIFWGFDGK
jgi:hypothetical protein